VGCSVVPLGSMLTMGFSNIYDRFIKHTHDPPVHPHHNPISRMPMNRIPKTSTKMDEEMDLMDDTMPAMATLLTERMPLWTLACLAEKLQKLKDTPKQNSDVMDCKSDDPNPKMQS